MSKFANPNAHKTNFLNFHASRNIYPRQLYNRGTLGSPDWGSPHFYVFCTHFQNLVFFFHKFSY